MNDCSSDETVDRIRAIADQRIKLVERPQNSGCPGIPRNEGVALAEGDLIAFLDADDLCISEKLKRHASFMEAHPEIPFSHTACGDVAKRIFQKFGIMLEGDDWRTGEDYEYYLRIAAGHSIGFIDEVLTAYRAQEENQSISQESGNWRGIPEHIPALRYILNHPEIWESCADRRTVVNAVAKACLENAWYWRDRDEKGRSKWFLHKALALKPFSIRLLKMYIAQQLKS